MKPDSYKVLDCCATCKHVFVMVDYESPAEYFCHIDKSARPPCGSPRMREVWIGNFGRGWDKWDEWADLREVVAQGYCRDHWSQDDA